MKTVVKSMPEPDNLAAFRTADPNGAWEDLRNGALHHGHEALQEIYSRTIRDQKGLCAYCECRIRVEDTLHRRIEHFHPKSDRSSNKNWDLDWQNMLAVCDGGTRSGHPLPKNMHCDARKGSVVYDGNLLNPLLLPLFPSLFAIHKRTGELKADKRACAGVTIRNNHCGTTKALVENTIEILNLNCPRLSDLRLAVVEAIDAQKKQCRKKGMDPKEALRELVKRFFSTNLPDWPEFFTTIRCCLGQTAEEDLHSINYQG